MITTVIKSKESISSGVYMPKVGARSIRVYGEIGETTSLIMRALTSGDIVSLSGCVFVIGGVESESYTFTQAGADVELTVKLTANEGYIYINNGVNLYRIRENWGLKSSPGGFNIDYRTYGNCLNLGSLLLNARTFNRFVEGIDMSSNISLDNAFSGCYMIDVPLVMDTSKVTTMVNALAFCSTFNQDLNWNTSSCQDMTGLFMGAGSFNKPLTSFDTSKNAGFRNMFNSAFAFNQDISHFDFSNGRSFDGFMVGKTYKDYNPVFYDKILKKLNNTTFNRTDIIKKISFGTIKHTQDGLADKNSLISKGWEILDGGEV